MDNAKTVQDSITELSDKYVALYKSFKEPSRKLDAEALALHDLIIQKYIWESVYDNVKAYIEDDKLRQI